MTGTDGTAGTESTGATGGTTLRLARRTDLPGLVPFLIGERAHLSGSRHPALFTAFVEDSLGATPRTTVVVAEHDGAIGAALLAVNGDLPGWYRGLPRRHPRAALALVAHRARKAPHRYLTRLRTRRAVPPATATAAHPRVPAALAGEPRLQQGPLAPGDPGPRPTDHGPGIAYCLYLLVGRELRGRGTGGALLTATLGHLRAAGATRYDCSFVPQDEAAARLYLALPFAIQRHPTGYFASLDLATVEPKALPA